MNAAAIDEALDFLANQSKSDVRWGGPFSVSATIHLLLVLFLPAAFEYQSIRPQEPIKVLEIKIMGQNDIALKGTGHDFTRGPLPPDETLSEGTRGHGNTTHGNTKKLSRAIAHRHKTATAAPEAPMRLTPRGPLFSMKGAAAAAVAEPGVGREKIYAASAVAKSYSASNNKGHSATYSASNLEPASGDGLVGAPGGTVELSRKRGSGNSGSGNGGDGGNGNFMSHGDGSVDGLNMLERRGEAIVVDAGKVTDDPLVERQRNHKAIQVPDTSSDAFFSISGPLSGRQILKMRLPRYPRWAEEKGIEAQISIKLSVLPNGKVMPNLSVETTSGFPELDKLTMDSIRAIQFAPLPVQENVRVEWGVATFNFRLKKATERG